MGIEVIESAETEHDWETDFAPKKSIVICPTCENVGVADKSEGDTDINQDNYNNINFKGSNGKDL